MSVWFRLKLAVYAAIQAWRQADDAVEAVKNSCLSGQGWNAHDYQDGFIDLYSPCYKFIESKDQAIGR